MYIGDVSDFLLPSSLEFETHVQSIKSTFRTMFFSGLDLKTSVSQLFLASSQAKFEYLKTFFRRFAC